MSPVRTAPWLLLISLFSVIVATAQSGPCTRRTSIVLSEIHYHPADPTPGNTEFIELYNSSPISVDLSGWKLRGDADFDFPPGTRLEGGKFLLIAADPIALQASGATPTTTILGPWLGALSNNNGTVRLRKASGGIVLETNYRDETPWPIAPDGAGHSLVLALPALGESQPQAWQASANHGGSPGRPEPTTSTPLDNIIISEVYANNSVDDQEFIELHNPGSEPADLSGCSLSQNRNLPGYQIPVGTIIAPGAYRSFAASITALSLENSGDTIFLRAADGLKVIAALRFTGQEMGHSWGRIHDWRELDQPTPDNQNAPPLQRPIVINEIHYHPSDDNDAAEFIELHNTGVVTVDLAGWKLEDAVDFTFPPASSISPGGFLVIAKHRSSLLALHPSLSPSITLGDYAGNLSNRSERLILTKPQNIIVDELTYFDGGRWPSTPDGGGTSLQLIDPYADNSQAPSWGAGDESSQAVSTIIEHTGVLDLGHTITPNATRFFIMMMGEGEAIVDNVEVLVNGSNRITNGDFTNGISGWKFFGTHKPSVVENAALHVVATDGGDLANLIETTLSTAIPAGTTVTLRATCRWKSGTPEILLGLNGGWLEAPGTLPVPHSVGTPGAANLNAGNIGPNITHVSHSPLLPQPGDPITIRAHVTDPNGVAAVRLRYRLDPANSLQQITMSHSGDGTYSATIPPPASGTMIAFHLVAIDTASPAAISRFPSKAPTRECLVRVGEVTPHGDLSTMRIWITKSTHDEWRDRVRSSNLELDGTFVSDGQVYYNVGLQYAGSQNGVTIYDSPTGNPTGYNISIPQDQTFLNTQKITIDRETTRDATRQRERLMFWFLEKLGLPNLHRRYVHVYLNGVERDQLIMEDVQKPNSEVMEEWFANSGRLTKTNPWFEFDPNGNAQIGASGALTNRLQHFKTTGDALKLPRYRWTWSHAAGHDSAHDFSGITALIDAAETPDANLAAAMSAHADLRQWMRTFAMNDLASFWDTFGNPGSKNAYLFESIDTGIWSILTWDMDVGLGVFNDPVNAPLFPANVDDNIKRLYAQPSIVRDYWQAIDEALASFFTASAGSEIEAILQETYNSLVANGAAVTSPFAPSGAYGLSIPQWITQRRTFLETQIAGKNADFSATTAPSSPNIYTTISGTAPLATYSITANGIPLELLWLSLTEWRAEVALQPGENLLNIVANSATGTITGNTTLTVQYTGTDTWPSLKINEWMAANPITSGILDPADGNADDWFELHNPTTNSVSLAGYYLSDDPANPLMFRIPDGFTMAPGGFILIWADDETAQNNPSTRPEIHTNFKLNAAGDSILLSAPDGTQIDHIDFATQSSGIAQHRYPDSANTFTFTLAPSPATSNPPPPTPTPATSVTAQLTDDVVTIEFQSLLGTIYQLETSTDLSTWTISSAPAAGTNTTLLFSTPALPRQCLYLRIRSF